jgi:hypothetical protein
MSICKEFAKLQKESKRENPLPGKCWPTKSMVKSRREMNLPVSSSLQLAISSESRKDDGRWGGK